MGQYKYYTEISPGKDIKDARKPGKIYEKSVKERADGKPEGD